ncbi:hypothetical protein BV25DRAFT_1836612 [Artomyces pyxidatus]|uniref:Uncharacterized protein n=1 Tax=Artomyces pyxidatus TaxID=48021 RepID=A0ACB8TAK4_9AGAM|nr:hypothetical protein BV25DRAFT_1836612 [Artomyces pyxidatus]
MRRHIDTSTIEDSEFRSSCSVETWPPIFLTRRRQSLRIALRSEDHPNLSLTTADTGSQIPTTYRQLILTPGQSRESDKGNRYRKLTVSDRRMHCQHSLEDASATGSDSSNFHTSVELRRVVAGVERCCRSNSVTFVRHKKSPTKSGRIQVDFLSIVLERPLGGKSMADHLQDEEEAPQLVLDPGDLEVLERQNMLALVHDDPPTNWADRGSALTTLSQTHIPPDLYRDLPGLMRQSLPWYLVVRIAHVFTMSEYETPHEFWQLVLIAKRDFRVTPCYITGLNTFRRIANLNLEQAFGFDDRLNENDPVLRNIVTTFIHTFRHELTKSINACIVPRARGRTPLRDPYGLFFDLAHAVDGHPPPRFPVEVTRQKARELIETGEFMNVNPQPKYSTRANGTRRPIISLDFGNRAVAAFIYTSSWADAPYDMQRSSTEQIIGWRTLLVRYYGAIELAMETPNQQPRVMLDRIIRMLFVAICAMTRWNLTIIADDLYDEMNVILPEVLLQHHLKIEQMITPASNETLNIRLDLLAADFMDRDAHTQESPEADCNHISNACYPVVFDTLELVSPSLGVFCDPWLLPLPPPTFPQQLYLSLLDLRADVSMVFLDLPHLHTSHPHSHSDYPEKLALLAHGSARGETRAVPKARLETVRPIRVHCSPVAHTAMRELASRRKCAQDSDSEIEAVYKPVRKCTSHSKTYPQPCPRKAGKCRGPTRALALTSTASSSEPPGIPAKNIQLEIEAERDDLDVSGTSHLCSAAAPESTPTPRA